MLLMSAVTWSARNESLNKLQSAIENRTHGRLSHLSIDAVNDAFIIKAHATTYHVVQLALAAIKAFVDEHPQLIPTTLSFSVNGHALVIRNPYKNAANDFVSPAVSTVTARRHTKQLATARSN